MPLRLVQAPSFRPFSRKCSALVVALVALAGGSACRHHGDFRVQYKEMRPSMLNGDWLAAGKELEASKEKVYREDDRVMYWLNLGTVQHYAGNFKASNEALVQAEAAMQDLWTTSITSEASKFVVSETMQPYDGEDFEKVLVYLYTALNQVELGQIPNAIVEARRADELLKKMLVHYEKEGEVGTLYKQDAFMLWLVGLFYEMEGRSGLNDAFLAYKAAYKSYKEDYVPHYGTVVPSFVGEDLVRTAKLLGFSDEAAKFERETGATGATTERLAANMAEVIVIHAAGEAPYKEEFSIDGIMPDAYVVHISLPKFVPVQFQCHGARIRTDSAEVSTELAEPVTAIVLKNFEHRLTAIKLRAIARATVKYLATKGAQAAVSGGEKASSERKLAGMLLGLAGNVAAAATEGADLRSWTTLPGAISIARMWLPAGKHTLDIEYVSRSGASVGRREQRTVELKAGQRQIVSVRSLQ